MIGHQRTVIGHLHAMIVLDASGGTSQEGHHP